MPSQDQLLIIVNPESGDKKNVIDVAVSVLPLLKHITYQLKISDNVAHVRTLAKEFLEGGEGSSILVAGGDGTIHEVINALVLDRPSDCPPKTLNLVLWPGGTANALFASIFSSSAPNPAHQHLIPDGTDQQTTYKLKSILAFIHSRSSPKVRSASPLLRRLTLAATEVFDEKSTRVDHEISVVVSSTSLHAAILKSAEDLRDADPTLGRFKTAARMNLTTWASSSVKIFGSDGATSADVQRYDPGVDALVPASPSHGDTSINLVGPFAYFLSTVNVDRLEPTFYVTAPFTTHPPNPDTKSMDILAIRPGRSPLVGQDLSKLQEKGFRQSFAEETLMATVMAAYDGGRHVKNLYGEGGEPVVEYIRAAGWEWMPDGDDEVSRLICIDGLVKTIPVGGRARCQVLQPDKFDSSPDGPHIPEFQVYL
ncbi:hypothetical protein FRB96_007177 [Tulasnella sp. 330]|nr:hypothetical protein FRB96_007177 [Tulasnella sp. 330]KAG8879303.1 hypothetical protein FRB97_001786 [Tulasnella sp. 331]KAG8883285.1 hypothetical protein FRB98_003193 [Tulasnella sp. 332]